MAELAVLDRLLAPAAPAEIMLLMAPVAALYPPPNPELWPLWAGDVADVPPAALREAVASWRRTPDPRPFYPEPKALRAHLPPWFHRLGTERARLRLALWAVERPSRNDRGGRR